LTDAEFSLDGKTVFPMTAPKVKSLQKIVPNCAFFDVRLTETGDNPHILEVDVKPSHGYIAAAFLIWW
jgi:hypothetical protein